MSSLPSPSSSFSSPGHRSSPSMREVGEASRAAMGMTASGLGCIIRPNLDRRWSLDNVSLASSSAREGYLRDLRRHHNAATLRDEGYPFMITERKNLLRRQSAAAASGSSCSADSVMTSSTTQHTSLSDRSGSPPPPGSALALASPSGSGKRSRSFSLDYRDEILHSSGVRCGGGGCSTTCGGTSGSGCRQHRLLSASGCCAAAAARKGLFSIGFSTSADVASTAVPEDMELPSIMPSGSAHLHRSHSLAVSSTYVPLLNMPADCESTGGKCGQGSKDSKTEYLRQRSSSLPRLLPPILDHDDDDAADSNNADEFWAGGKRSQQQYSARGRREQASHLVYREMQKFVCRNSIDASAVLPLPFQTHPRRRPMNDEHRGVMQNCTEEGIEEDDTTATTATTTVTPETSCSVPVVAIKQHSDQDRFTGEHCEALIRAVAKLHAVSRAIMLKNPTLFEHIIEWLDSCKGPQDVGGLTQQKGKAQQQNQARGQNTLYDEDEALALAARATPLLPGDPALDAVKRQLDELRSREARPFAALVHGRLVPSEVSFRYDGSGRVVCAQLNSLGHVGVASPLLDVYAVSYVFADADTLAQQADRPYLLQAYLDTYWHTASRLLAETEAPISLESLKRDFEEYQLAGALLASSFSLS